MRLDPFSTGVELCYYLCGVWRDFLTVHRLTSQKSKKPIPLARLGFSHIGRGTIARGHDGHRRQFFLTQSNVEAGELATLTPQFGILAVLAGTHLLFLAKGSPQFASNRGDHFGSIGISENPCILLEPLEIPQISATLLPRKVRHAEFFRQPSTNRSTSFWVQFNHYEV